MEDLIEDNILMLEEEEAIALLAILELLDDEFNRLVPQVFAQLQSGLSPLASREELLLELIPELPVDPEKDPIQKSVEKLLQRSSTLGLDQAAALSGSLVPAPVAAGVSTALIAAAATRARGYIGVQARSFSESVSESVRSGLLDNQSLPELKASLQRSLKVTKARIETVIKTEAAKSRFESAMTFFSQQGIELFWYYVRWSEWTCPHCAAMAGKVFRAGAMKLPRHYRCHCDLIPYKKNASDKKSVYEGARKIHRSNVLRYAKDKGIQLDEGPAAFEQLRPVPYGKDA